MKVAIQIPLKHRGSTRVPNKNFRDLSGKPLCHWLMDELIDQLPPHCDIFIDSENEAVMELFPKPRYKRLKFHQRQPWFAGDQANGNHLVSQFALAHPEYALYFQAYVTAVTLPGTIVNEAIDALMTQADTYDSVVLVTEETGWIWQQGQALNYDPSTPNGLPRSQDAMYYKETTGLYGITRDAAFRTGCRIGTSPLFYPVERKYAFDIDTMEDFYEAESILNRVKAA